MGNETFTDKEFQKALESQIKEWTDKTSNEKPKAYLVVGQPGAGKTTISNMLQKQYADNIIFINGDEYRKKHPHYKDLYKEYGEDAVLKTQAFSGKMTEALIDKLSDKKYNLIIEGTLRTTETPLKTKRLLEDKGYNVELSVMLVRPEISYLSTLKRYHEMKEAGTTPRNTPKEHHDLVVKNIIDNVHTLYSEKSFSEITMYNRNQDKLYSLKDTPYKDPSKVMQKEFSRSLSIKEKLQLKDEYGKYVKDNDMRKILSQTRGLER